MNNSLLIGLIIFFLTQACTTSTVGYSSSGKSIQGIYRSQNTDLYFEFHSDRFILATSSLPREYDCCDTLSFGKFKLEHKGSIISLYSPEDFVEYDFLNIKVKEDYDSTHLDTIKVVITNHIENLIERQYAGRRLIEYRLVFDAIPTSLMVESSKAKFLGTEIKINAPRNRNIFSMEILVQVTSEFDRQSLGKDKVSTYPYEVQNPQSNLFIIDLPDLTLERFTHIRMKRELVEIVNNHHIKWNGQSFEK